MKKFFKFVMILFLLGCNNSDYVEEAPSGYLFVIEGGNQNRLIRNDKIVIDSGLVKFKYNKNYIVFSIDTIHEKKVDKNKLLYYIHDVKKDSLYKNMNIKDFRKKINSISKELDISK